VAAVVPGGGFFALGDHNRHLTKGSATKVKEK